MSGEERSRYTEDPKHIIESMELPERDDAMVERIAARTSAEIDDVFRVATDVAGEGERRKDASLMRKKMIIEEREKIGEKYESWLDEPRRKYEQEVIRRQKERVIACFKRGDITREQLESQLVEAETVKNSLGVGEIFKSKIPGLFRSITSIRLRSNSRIEEIKAMDDIDIAIEWAKEAMDKGADSLMGDETKSSEVIRLCEESVSYVWINDLVERNTNERRKVLDSDLKRPSKLKDQRDYYEDEYGEQKDSYQAEYLDIKDALDEVDTTLNINEEISDNLQEMLSDANLDDPDYEHRIDRGELDAEFVRISNKEECTELSGKLEGLVDIVKNLEQMLSDANLDDPDYEYRIDGGELDAKYSKISRELKFNALWIDYWDEEKDKFEKQINDLPDGSDEQNLAKQNLESVISRRLVAQQQLDGGIARRKEFIKSSKSELKSEMFEINSKLKKHVDRRKAFVKSKLSEYREIVNKDKNTQKELQGKLKEQRKRAAASLTSGARNVNLYLDDLVQQEEFYRDYLHTMNYVKGLVVGPDGQPRSINTIIEILESRVAELDKLRKPDGSHAKTATLKESIEATRAIALLKESFAVFKKRWQAVILKRANRALDGNGVLKGDNLLDGSVRSIDFDYKKASLLDRLQQRIMYQAAEQENINGKDSIEARRARELSLKRIEALRKLRDYESSPTSTDLGKIEKANKQKVGVRKHDGTVIGVVSGTIDSPNKPEIDMWLKGKIIGGRRLIGLEKYIKEKTNYYLTYRNQVALRDKTRLDNLVLSDYIEENPEIEPKDISPALLRAVETVTLKLHQRIKSGLTN